jgi:uncharacterized protein (TIGR03435 family)
MRLYSVVASNRVSAACCLWIIGFVNCVTGQDLSSQTPAFEVASIHRMEDGVFKGLIQISGTHVTVEGSLMHFIEVAYGFKSYQVFGGSDSARHDLYRITAITPGATQTPRPVVRQMLQSLLRERFGLVVHNESRVVPTYSLMLAKDGAKMEASPVGRTLDITLSGGPVRRLSGSISMQSLAQQLSSWLGDRPVIDNTDLFGLFEVSLEWSSDQLDVDQAEETDREPLAGSIFTALKQLGLRLEPRKQATAVIVIDRSSILSEN